MNKLPPEFKPLNIDSIQVNRLIQNIETPPIPTFDKPIQEVIIKTTPKTGIEGFVERHQGKIALLGLFFAILAFLEAIVIFYLQS